MEHLRDIPPKHVKTRGVELPWSMVFTLLLYVHFFASPFVWWAVFRDRVKGWLPSHQSTILL